MTRMLRTKVVVAVVAAFVAFGGVQGFAASPGAGTGGLGATSRIVGSCGSGLTFGYGVTFDAGISGYAVDRLELSNIPAGCLGKTLTATFYDQSSAEGLAVTATLPATGTTETISIDPSSNTIDAGRVGGVSVVVS